MFASIAILNLKFTQDIYTHMKAFMIAYGLLMSGHPKQKLFHKTGLFFLMMNELYYVAFTGGITFIAFYMILSTEKLGSIFFNAAGLLFVNDMPVVLGMFLSKFVLKDKIGENAWIVFE